MGRISQLHTVHRVAGSGEAWWTDGTIDYPDGSRWFFTQMLQLRDARIYRETWYFAPTLEAPGVALAVGGADVGD